jgi:hypothetical protein
MRVADAQTGRPYSNHFRESLSTANHFPIRMENRFTVGTPGLGVPTVIIFVVVPTVNEKIMNYEL